MPFLPFRRGSFAVHIGIICRPIWGSFPVRGSFAVGDHLRRCTVCYFGLNTMGNDNLKNHCPTGSKLCWSDGLVSDPETDCEYLLCKSE